MDRDIVRLVEFKQDKWQSRKSECWGGRLDKTTSAADIMEQVMTVMQRISRQLDALEQVQQDRGLPSGYGELRGMWQ